MDLRKANPTHSLITNVKSETNDSLFRNKKHLLLSLSNSNSTWKRAMVICNHAMQCLWLSGWKKHSTYIFKLLFSWGLLEPWIWTYIKMSPCSCWAHKHPQRTEMIPEFPRGMSLRADKIKTKGRRPRSQRSVYRTSKHLVPVQGTSWEGSQKKGK